MPVLVTGGSGFIGSRVVDVFSKNGISVILADIVNPKSHNNEAMFIRTNALDLKNVKRILRNHDVSTVINLIGLPHVDLCQKNPHLSFQLNVQSVQCILEGMRESGCDKIIFASSAAVYGYHSSSPVTEDTPPKPNTTYGYHKFAAEQIIKTYRDFYGINAVIFRLFNVYGRKPMQGEDVISILIRRALKGEPLIVKGGDKFRDFIHIEDVAKVFLTAHIKKIHNVTINIGSGAKITIRDVAKIINSHFPHVDLLEEKTPDDGTGIYADISLARKLLNFEPRETKKGIDNYVAFYGKTHHAVN